MIYTRLVFFNIALLIAPMPVQNITPPANDKATFIIVDVSGKIDGINSQIQKINTNENGYTNFWRFRNRCIYVINKEYSILVYSRKAKKEKKEIKLKNIWQ